MRRNQIFRRAGHSLRRKIPPNAMSKGHSPMADNSIAQKFQSSYSGSRRIVTGFNQPFGESVKVFGQKPKSPNRRELAQWFKQDAIESLNRPVYEARRMIGDIATICHIDYNPTAAMTPRWEAYGMAYGVRFIVTLWQEDIEFLNCVKSLGIGKTDYTPEQKLDVIVKRYDAKRGLSGVSGVFHEHKAVFVGEETPLTRKFQPAPQKLRQEWKESPFKSY
jgi:hypothetical protein